MNKIALIYQFNQSSPLFAHIASSEIERKNYDKAIEILERGLEIYPDYPTAHLIYGIALAFIGNNEKAEEEIKKGCENINSEKTLDHYLKEIEEISSRNGIFSQSRKISFLPDNLVDLEENLNEELNSGGDSIVRNKEDLEDDLEILAEKISHAEIPSEIKDDIVNDTGLDLSFKDRGIVSETLANIYSAQGNLSEALGMYEKLKDVHPEKEQYFDEKIQELKDKQKENK